VRRRPPAATRGQAGSCLPGQGEVGAASVQESHRALGRPAGCHRVGAAAVGGAAGGRTLDRQAIFSPHRGGARPGVHARLRGRVAKGPPAGVRVPCVPPSASANAGAAYPVPGAGRVGGAIVKPVLFRFWRRAVRVIGYSGPAAVLLVLVSIGVALWLPRVDRDLKHIQAEVSDRTSRLRARGAVSLPEPSGDERLAQYIDAFPMPAQMAADLGAIYTRAGRHKLDLL